MTVTTELATVTHVGNGVTTEFNIPYKFLETDHLQVTRTVVATGAGTIVAPSDYTAIGAGEDSGGTLEYEYLGSPLTSTYSITIERVVPITQDLDIEREGNFDPAALEVQLDLMVMQIQKLKADLANAISGGTITSITDAVAGPGSATDGNIVIFNGASGALLSDSGYAPTDFADADHTHPQLATTWTEITKTANNSITSSTTFANDADLTFTMEDNSTYLIDATLWIYSPTSVGFKVGTTGPASPVLVDTTYAEIASNGTDFFTGLQAYGSLRANSPTGNRTIMVQIKMRVENGVNAGVFALQFAQNSSSVSATIFYKGSTLRYRKIQ